MSCKFLQEWKWGLTIIENHWFAETPNGGVLVNKVLEVDQRNISLDKFDVPHVLIFWWWGYCDVSLLFLVDLVTAASLLFQRWCQHIWYKLHWRFKYRWLEMKYTSLIGYRLCCRAHWLTIGLCQILAFAIGQEGKGKAILEEPIKSGGSKSGSCGKPTWSQGAKFPSWFHMQRNLGPRWTMVPSSGVSDKV